MLNNPFFTTVFHPYADMLTELARSALNRQQSKLNWFLDYFSPIAAARPSHVDLDRDWVTVGRAADLSAEQPDRLDAALHQLKPWRKGPFEVFGRKIDSEWNSALKWERVAPHIKPLAGRKILDVGSSNGYYGFRMAAHAPRLVLGIEPYLTYFFQYHLLQNFIKTERLHCLPLELHDLMPIRNGFDTIFCMGVLYHCRSPLDTLAQLHALLVPGGELVLETLIMEADDDSAFFPKNRYASMRNVFFIPTVGCLHNWLERSRFTHICCVDITRTGPDEQRKTQWIDSKSLDSFLDPVDFTRTIEGYPAPVRAVLLAEAKPL